MTGLIRDTWPAEFTASFKATRAERTLGAWFECMGLHSGRNQANLARCSGHYEPSRALQKETRNVAPGDRDGMRRA